MLKACEIQWDVDAGDIWLQLDSMTDIDAANALNISVEKYKALSEEKKEELAVSYFENRPKELANFMELPYNVTVPNNIAEEDIADWLSDTYYFCHRGFYLVEK